MLPFLDDKPISRSTGIPRSSMREHNVKEGSATNAGGRASASTTAKEAGASNAAARASASRTAKEAASASWLPCVCVLARVYVV